MFDKQVKKLDISTNILENNQFFKLAESCDQPSKSSSLYIPPNESSSKDNANFKYKPDWICSDKNCNNLNFARRTHCNMCGLKRTDEVELDYSSQSHPDRDFLNNKRNKTTLKPGEWFCPNCNILNFSVRTVCVRCFTEKPIVYEKYEDSKVKFRSKNSEVKESNKHKDKKIIRNIESRQRKVNKEDSKNHRKSYVKSHNSDSSEESKNYEKSRKESDCEKTKINETCQQYYANNIINDNQNTNVNCQYFQNHSNFQHQQQGNSNLVENFINFALSIGNMTRNNSTMNSVNVNQQNISQQNVFCPNYIQGSNIQLQSLVQSFLYIMSQKMEQRAFCEFSNTFINLINQFIMNGSVSN